MGLEELPGLRTADARFFRAQGAEGPHVVQLSLGPLNYQGPDGAWHPIDTRIVPTPTGYRNGGNSFRIDFPTALTPLTPVKVELSEGSVSFYIDGSLSGPAQPADESLLYPGLLPSTDVEYRLTASGYVERVILRTPDASGRVTWRLRLDGLTLADGTNGELELRAGDEVVGVIPPRSPRMPTSTSASGKGRGRTTWPGRLPLSEDATTT